ncbi:hypothetical protein VB773_12120 [Haloarculaceae archaeon H-GB2-1]|nr:hypothetical protein [Haloarculaceae archaeon H-GB11]MEA5408229.1 hypothetical protein [Haloarculaceae archaeon H-GB2-1]
MEVRDEATNRDQYTPKAGAKFTATDTGTVFVGDGSEWTRVESTGTSPTFQSVTATAVSGGTRTETLHAVVENTGEKRFDVEVSGLDAYDSIAVELDLHDSEQFTGGNFRYTVNDGDEHDILRGEDFTGHGTLLFSPIAPWADNSPGYTIRARAATFGEQLMNTDRIVRPNGFSGIESIRLYVAGSSHQLDGRVTVSGITERASE